MPSAQQRLHEELRRALAMVDADGAQLLSRLNLTIKVRSEMVRTQTAAHFEACRLAFEAGAPEPPPIPADEQLKAPGLAELGAVLHLRDELEELLGRTELALVRLFDGEDLLPSRTKTTPLATVTSPVLVRSER